MSPSTPGPGTTAHLEVTRDGPVARVVLDRPPVNVLTPELIRALGEAFRGLGAASDLRVVVLAARGRSFSAGVDVGAMRNLDPTTARPFIAALHQTIRAVQEVPVPVVARLHGHVLGGALELVLGCDFRLAGRSCRLGMPEVRVGIPSVIEAALLPGLVGWGRTAEMLLLGEPIGGDDALEWGLVNRVVDDDALDAEVAAWTGRLAALPPGAVRLQKALLARWRRVDLDSAIALSLDAFALACGGEETRRAMQAFLDRPRPSAAARPA